MSPAITASSALRFLYRSSSRIGSLPLPRRRLFRQPVRSPVFRPFSTTFPTLHSVPKDSPREPQTSRLVEQPETPQPPIPSRPPQPSYDITFTCTPCSTRSTHRITKHAYHHGSILITCPSCRNRHIISDHLNVSKISRPYTLDTW
jgi:protein import protein ZIM17